MKISPVFVTHVAALSCCLLCLKAYGQQSVHEESRQLALSNWPTVNDASAELETIRVPVDVTGPSPTVRLPHTNWQFGTEFLLYDLEYGNVNFQNNEGDEDLAGGLRLTFGWESNAGYGIRARVSGVSGEGSSDSFFGNTFTSGGFSTLRGFDFRGASPVAAGSEPLEIVTATSNIDIYKRLQFDRLDVALGAGLSGGAISLDVPTVNIDNSIIAGGISLFTEGKYVLRQSEVSELSLVGSGRVAFLRGEWESTDGTGFLQMDSDLTITEGAVGLEWKRHLGRATLNLRAQYESQLWNSDVTSDLVFNGAALRAGLTW